MEGKDEVIAVVVDAGLVRHWRGCALAHGAQRLVRHADGSVTLEAIESEEEFERTARTTGCFRRGKAIRDPRSHEVIGYEMEEISLAPAPVRC